MLRKDAKIAIIVILLLMVVVVVIWGQNPRPDTAADAHVDPGAVAVTEAGAATNTVTPSAPRDPIADLRRQAPTHPPTNADASPDQPIAMMNNLPPRAALIHEGEPPPERRIALKGLPTGPASPLDARGQERDLSPLAERPKPRPEPKPKCLATHVIAKGDSYTGLAAKYYKDGKKWRLIYEANKVPPQSLTIGRKINIPHLPEPKPLKPSAPAADGTSVAKKLADKAPGDTIPTPEGNAKPRTYTVGKGESFYSIARKIYRDPTRWKKLYEHNRSRLPKPTNPSSLRVGTLIELPVLASAR